MKKCSHCKQLLNESAYCKNRSRKDGLHHSCRKCHSKFKRVHYYTHQEIEIQRSRNWNNSNKKRFNEICRKHNAKRKRNLGLNILFENPFNESEIIEWHHINNTDVVALPKDLHTLYLGKYHRERIMIIVKQIYP